MITKSSNEGPLVELAGVGTCADLHRGGRVSRDYKYAAVLVRSGEEKAVRETGLALR
jgi:hypothetical protein